MGKPGDRLIASVRALAGPDQYVKQNDYMTGDAHAKETVADDRPT